MGAEILSVISWMITACVTNWGFPTALENDTKIVIQAPKNIPIERTRRIGAAASHSSPRAIFSICVDNTDTSEAIMATEIPTIIIVLEKYFFDSWNECLNFFVNVGNRN